MHRLWLRWVVTGYAAVVFIAPLIADKVGASVVTATRVTDIILEVSLTKRTLNLFLWDECVWYIGNHNSKTK